MLLTTGQAAQELGCAITTLRRLVRAELLPGITHHGVRVMIPLDAVRSLAARNPAPLQHLDADEIAVLRVDAARPTGESDGEWTGFTASLTPEILLKALRGWWRCDAASVAAGGVLPVTVAGYVVALLTGLEQWESNAQGRRAFPNALLAGYVTDLATPTKILTATAPEERRLADQLLGTRLPSHSSGPIAYVSTAAEHG
ncbi:helix-turn-helix domain-containing protein [Streptomyces luteocolor]|uniref:helix-turn-helix domain-containing protein n=1 Tax=Streptomyces luteocolor TaxID=285500 RepID=UPI000852CB8B|nr:helix-turn-helix domain-containing protein [Streptomyces luteocolor]